MDCLLKSCSIRWHKDEGISEDYFNFWCYCCVRGILISLISFESFSFYKPRLNNCLVNVSKNIFKTCKPRIRWRIMQRQHISCWNWGSIVSLKCTLIWYLQHVSKNVDQTNKSVILKWQDGNPRRNISKLILTANFNVSKLRRHLWPTACTWDRNLLHETMALGLCALHVAYSL